MNLDDFIASALAQITKGVQRAQEEADENDGAWVSPVGERMPILPGVTLMPMGNNEFGYLQSVAFDVAITASDKVEGEGVGGVKVFGVSASGGAAVSNQNTLASRVQFNVPVVLPGIRASTREEKIAKDRQKSAQRQSAAVRRAPRYF